MPKLLAIAAGAALTAAAGCASSRTPTTNPSPQPNPQSRVSADVSQRVKQLRDVTDQLQQQAQSLPVDTEDDQRAGMHGVFDLLARGLPLLMGPDADGQFRLQQRIVADARDRLAAPGTSLATAPTIDSGLRAAYNALVRISQESFYTSPSITKSITELHHRVDDLDTVRGPLHRSAVARAVQQTAAVMDQMTNIYAARLDRRGVQPAAPNP
jgi:hypothetical protein